MPIDTSPLLAMNTLWQLLEAALEDIERVERDERYIVQMNTWHDGFCSQCHVCAAGSILAKRCGAQASEWLEPSDFATAVADRLCAVDALRCGEVSDAYDHLFGEDAEADDLTVDDRHVTEYAANRDQFFADCRALLADLKAAGI